jgi:DNA polymerase III delta prime subunit
MEEIEFLPKKERKQHIWVEKYRPEKLEDYLGNDTIKETFKSYVDQQDLCHILLYGGPGTGKTTLAKMLVRAIACDHIYINASDERTLEVIRDKIKGFASSSGFKPLKIIILDEFDGFPDLSQRTLRSIMEVYALNTRFILTANYHERIIDPIKSRIQGFQLAPPTRKDIALHVINILKLENVTFTNEDLKAIMDTYYPDIRKIIQTCQQCSVTGSLKLSKTILVEHDLKNKIVEMLRVRAPFVEIRKYVVEQDLKRFEEIYEYLYEKLDVYAEGKQASVILKIADGIRNDTLSINKQIMFLACIVEILKSLKTT